MPFRPLRPLTIAAIAALVVVAAACGSDDGDEAAASSGPGRVTLRLGYFPNVTHATAIAGVDRGIFAAALGSGVQLETKTFNAGPAAVEAIFSGALDATYIGPNPAINAWHRSKGEAIRIVSGATSGGAALVVKSSISSAQDLKGKKVATPQLGNTQDVALRYWLGEQGLETDQQGGGDVSVVPQENAQTLDAFRSGVIDGAWVPEPWVTRLVQEGGGKVLVDERDLWPGKQFVTTHLIVRTEFLEDHPEVVGNLVKGQVQANDFVNANPAEAQRVVNDGIGKLTGKPLKPETIQGAWKNLTFTNDPIASSLKGSADHAEKVGLLEDVDLDGIYELGPLNRQLQAASQPEVAET